MARDRSSPPARPTPVSMQETLTTYVATVLDRLHATGVRLAALACVLRPFEATFDLCGSSGPAPTADPEGWDHAFLDDAHARPEDRRPLAWLDEQALALAEAEGKDQARLYEELVESLTRAVLAVKAKHPSIEDAFVLAEEDDGDVAKARKRAGKLAAGKLGPGWAKL